MLSLFRLSLFRRAPLTNEERIVELRRRGVKIGDACTILSMGFSTEPYLIEIGDRVAIADGVEFVTHDGLAGYFRDKHPAMQVFGRIRVGSGTFIGMNSIVLPGVEIGSNCIVGAGSVVRHAVPDDSLVIGNPAQVVGNSAIVIAKLAMSPHRLDVFDLPEAERRRRIEEHFGIT